MSEPHHIDPIVTATGMGIEIAYGRLELATAWIFRVGTPTTMRGLHFRTVLVQAMRGWLKWDSRL